MANLQNTFSSAYEYFIKKQFIGSLKLLAEAEKFLIQEKTNDWEISIENLKGFNYLGLNNIDTARNCFETALKLDEKSSQACAGLAEIFFIEGKDNEAKLMFEYAVINNPENIFASSGLAKVNRLLGLPEEHNSIDKQQLIPVQDYRAVIMEAGRYFSEADYSKTVNSLNSIEETLENDITEMIELLTEVSNMKGTACLEIYQLDEARKSFEKALNLSPESSTACWGLGEIFFRSNMLREAKTMYEWALKHDENNRAAKEAISKIDTLISINESPQLSNKLTLKLASGKTIEL